jgi:hypothetical protein
MAMLSDTSPEAQKVLIECYRRMPITRKGQNLAEDFAFARMLHAAGLRGRQPGVTLAEIQADWIQSTLGYPCPFPLREPDMEPHQQLIQKPLREVIAVLDRMQILYAIGGAVASSLYGIGRFTRDIDLTVEQFVDREQEFVQQLPPDDYFVNPDAVTSANCERSSCNIIHFQSGFKFDIFIRKDLPFEIEAFGRRMSEILPDNPEQPLAVHSPEDVILFNLPSCRTRMWEQPFRDILGIMQTRSGQLDNSYLDHWAAELKVADLLVRARQEV